MFNFVILYEISTYALPKAMIIDKVSEYAKNLLTTKLDKNYLYHNLIHTERVVNAAKTICEALEVSPSEQEIITIAAWLHDLGYTKGNEVHEETSCEITKNFLTQQNYDPEKIDLVIQVIMATKMDHKPNNLMEEIIKDADSYHFSDENFSKISELLQQELQLLGIAEYTTEQWREKNIEVLNNKHQYYTSFARENWGLGKLNNINELIRKTQKAKNKQENPDRGVQTLFRVSLRNHIQLSAIADTKANILLSINAIIISLALSNLIPKLDSPSNQHLIIPTLVLVVFSVVSVIFAVLSTKPNLSSGRFTREDLDNRNVNLLFFGNFHKMKYEEYEDAVMEMIQERDYIYESMTKDLHSLGTVLAKKYRLLRITYYVFLFGLIISVLTFGLSFGLI
jgi:HD superfamily phosphodiesterase